MNRLTRMFRASCAWSVVLGLAGCNQLEKLDGTTGGGSGIPPEVSAAFERSCGKVGCHVSGGTAPNLTGGSLDALVGTEYVTIGDIPASFIALKLLSDATLMDLGIVREGQRMPLGADFTNLDDATLQDTQVILAWIAGAEFSGADGTTGGDMTAPTFTNVKATLMTACTCHQAAAGPGNGSLSFMGDTYASIVDTKSVGLPAMNLITPNDPSNSYLYLKITGDFMAAGGPGGAMPPGTTLAPEKVLLIEEWINAGAPND